MLTLRRLCTFAFFMQLLGAPLGQAEQLSLHREASFELFMRSNVDPWFAAGESGLIEGIPAAGKPVKLFYRAFRQAGARAHIVIVHGFGERSEKFAELAYDFFAAGLNVYIFDQRGFGRSSRLHSENAGVYVDQFASYAVDLKILLDKVVKADESTATLPVLIFAHSMGGAVSTVFAQLYPELPRALILSAPMHEPRLMGVPHGIAAGLASLLDMLGWGQSYAFGQKAPRQQLFAKAATQSWPRWNHYISFVSRPEEAPRATGGATFHWLREALRTTATFEDAELVKKIKAPILIFQATDDGYVDNEAQVRFCSLAPRCTLQAVPLSKHEIYREKDTVRAPYLEKILAFIDQEVGPPRTP